MTSEKDILKQFGLENDKDLQHFLDEMDAIAAPVKLTKEEAWSRFEQSIQEKAISKKIAKSLSIRYIILAAASIALIIGISITFNNWDNIEYSTGAGKMLTVTLPDNSSVTLNASSKISWKKFRWSSSRKVNFEGEAFFKVMHGNKFEVISNNNSVKVLGTEFNINSRADYFEVNCYKGKVEVNINHEKKMVITKGQAVKKESKDKSVEVFNLSNTESASWMHGEFFYNDAPLQQVFDEIARQFNIKLSYKDESRRYSGFFRKSSLDSALNNVCLPMGLKYEIKADSVIIR